MPGRREFLKSAALAAPAAWITIACGRRSTPDAGEPPFEGNGFGGAKAGQERIVAGVSFRWCPPGQFTMGSPPEETGRRADEAQVSVTLTRGFWIGRHEVTQGEWRRTVGAWPSRPPTPEFGEGADLPAYWVSYLDAEAFCSRLRERGRASGELASGWTVRVPTEAEWEYACRAGTTTATAFGGSLGRDQANFSGEPLNGGSGGPAVGRASPVGSYPANRWGICDMHGNIFEWCRDWYHARLPGGVDPDLSTVMGVRNRDGTHSRVRRGGAWNDPGWACRSALRLRYEPERSSDHIGFRIVVAEI